MNEPDGVAVTEEKPFPVWWKAILWILLYFILQIALTVVGVVVAAGGSMDVLGRLSGGMDDKANMAVIAQGGIWGLILSGVAIIAILLFNLRKPGRKEAIGLYAPSRLSLVQTIGFGVAALAIAFVLAQAYATYVVPDVELQKAIKELLAAVPQTPFNLALIFLAAAVIAPIVEELLFRGYLQTAFDRMMNGHAAVWLAAVLFGAVHMDMAAMPILVMLGAAFGYIYQRTGSLKTNILLHVANNALALAFM